MGAVDYDRFGLTKKKEDGHDPTLSRMSLLITTLSEWMTKTEKRLETLERREKARRMGGIGTLPTEV